MEWMCAECGAPHPRNDPPCRNCGAMQFEKTVVRQRPEGETNPATVEWECSECGRRHSKNNPPCNDCGTMQLESVEVDYSTNAVEAAAGFGARDVVKFVGAVVVVGVLAFVALNSGALDAGPPTVEDAPGEANASSGLDLNTAEVQIYENVDEERSSEDRGTLSLDPDTRAMAEYYNQLMVKRGEYPLDRSSEDVFAGFSSCSNPDVVYNWLESDDRAIDYYGSEDELARELSRSWLTDSDTGPTLRDRSASKMGVDVHVDEDGTVVSTVALC